MILHYSDLFLDNVRKLPTDIKKVLQKKLDLMIENPRHPSLRTKKIQGREDIFEASVTLEIRLTWQYTEDGLLLRNIGEHDKTLKNP